MWWSEHLRTLNVVHVDGMQDEPLELATFGDPTTNPFARTCVWIDMTSGGRYEPGHLILTVGLDPNGVGDCRFIIQPFLTDGTWWQVTPL